MQLLVVALQIRIVPTRVRTDEPSPIDLREVERHVSVGNTVSFLHRESAARRFGMQEYALGYRNEDQQSEDWVCKAAHAKGCRTKLIPIAYRHTSVSCNTPVVEANTG